MSVRLAPIRYVLLAAVWVACVRPSFAQHVEIRQVEPADGDVVVDVAVDWPESMGSVADSASITSFTAASARALSFGLPMVFEAIELPDLRMPRVSLLSAEYDELDLPQGDTTAAPELAGDVVRVEGLGISRKQPTASLVIRLLTYESGTVRRYRRIRAAVQYDRRSNEQAFGALRTTAGDNPHLQVEESVLAGGIVYKVPVTHTGMYRIDREFLSNLPGLSISPDDLDPNHVRVYGNGGAPLPARNDAPRNADLVENAVHRSGGGDGSFDAGDAVVFYGKAPSGWTFGGDAWEHYVHPFSNENYYFIELGDADGETLSAASFPGYTDAEVVSETEGRYFVDFDEFMWSKENGTGHTWVTRPVLMDERRELLSGLMLPGRTDGVVAYRIRTAIRSNPAARVLFESAGSVLGSLQASRSVTTSETSAIAVPGIADFSEQLAAGAPLNLSMYLDPEARNAPEAAVDWLRVFYPRRLTASGDSLHFATPGGRSGRFEFVLGGFSGQPQVWDVTDHQDIRRLGVRTEGTSYRVQVQVDDPSRPRELVAFRPAVAQTLTPSQAQRVENQNLHAPDGRPDFVIVVPEAFRASAEELAEYRRQDGLDVLVADVSKIYNEFSGGLMDVRGLRDYLRFLYDRGLQVGRPLRYALLFGDGHFNYRNLGSETQQAELTNWIPPYETEESFDPDESYTSDDYYGLLDPEEGSWDWPGRSESTGTERVDVGIGRLPVQTPEEAAAMVAKIKHFEDPSTYGPWRTRYLFVADDAYNGIRPQQEDQPDLHTQNADVVAELIEQQYPWVNLRKVYGISYTREFLSGWRLPSVERDLQSILNEGVLVMNYSGHGGEFSLAQEEIFTKEDALSMRNYDKLPIFITATCSFGWWDLGNEQSAAEALLLNDAGGAIALMTTVRLVYTSAGINTLNVGLNRALNQEMFMASEDGRARRLGDILVSTKNTMPGLQGNNRKFNLLGDPTMRVGYPEREAAIETIDGTPVDEAPKLQALDEVTVEGSVRTPAGDVDSSFDGQVSLTIFDADRRVHLPVRVAMPRDYYVVREDLIWRGAVPVSGGRFDATFVVPKDISYSNEPGRVSAYVHNAEDHAVGYTENAIVGGTAANPPDDAVGPELSLFLNDTTFVSGGLTPQHPRLIVKLRDDSGINTVGAGVGHEMLLIVDGDEQQAVDIGGRFESDPSSHRSGRVEYSFEEYPDALEDGPHSLSVRAWDVLNNSSSEILEFVVSSNRDVVLNNVYNYPNPTTGQTRFIFEHNQPTGTAADVQIRIYTLSGRPIRTIATEEALPSGVLTAGPVQVPWDGRDEDLNPLASGIYLYKVRVVAEGVEGERHVSERIEKLAIIR